MSIKGIGGQGLSGKSSRLHPYVRLPFICLLAVVILVSVYKIAQATAILLNIDIPGIGGTADFTVSLDSGDRISSVTGTTVHWIRNTVTNNLTNTPYVFNWRTAGPPPAGFSGSAGSGPGTSAIWEWEATSTIYSIGCSTLATNPLPANYCITFDPSNTAVATPVYRFAGRSLISTGVTPSTASVTTAYKQAFSPERPVFEVVSAVQELTNGQFEYTTTVHNQSDFSIRFEIASGPLGCSTCGPGFTDCAGTCTNLFDDEKNCGACGNVCGGGTCCLPFGLAGVPVCQDFEGECPVCGNGIQEFAERCDGTDFHNLTCDSFGFCGGTLACNNFCRIVTADCELCPIETLTPSGAVLSQPEVSLAVVTPQQGQFDTCEFPIGCNPPCPSGSECIDRVCQPIIEAPSQDSDVSLLSGALQASLQVQPAVLGRVVEVPPGGFAPLDCSIEDVPAKEIPTQITANCGVADGECTLGAAGVSGPVVVFVPDRTMTLGAAFLAAFRTEVRDSSGNGQIEPGETADLFVSLINARPGGLTGLGATLSDEGMDLDCHDLENGQCLVPGGDVATDPILVTHAGSAYPDIPGADINSTDTASCLTTDTNKHLTPVPVQNTTPFGIVVPPDHPEDTTHPLTLRLTGRLAGSGAPVDILPVTFTVGVGRACVPGALANDFDTLQGLLSPLARLVPQGSVVPMPGMPFKMGSTLPLKLRLACGSMPLTGQNASPPRIVALARDGVAINLATLNLDAGGANSNNLAFRFDPKMGQWVYNGSTKGLAAGGYVITIQMPNGRNYDAGFRLIP